MRRLRAVGALALAGVLPALLSAAAAETTIEAGQAIYKRANCVGCHKWHGGGGGGYGGAALSLRKTPLSKDQIATVVRCGRPGTGMPYFDRDSYPPPPGQPACYGLKRDDLAHLPLAQGGIFLKPEEADAVAAYVVQRIEGKGEVTLADCVAFFGEHSSVCDAYQAGHHHTMPTPSTTQ